MFVLCTCHRNVLKMIDNKSQRKYSIILSDLLTVQCATIESIEQWWWKKPHGYFMLMHGFPFQMDLMYKKKWIKYFYNGILAIKLELCAVIWFGKLQRARFMFEINFKRIRWFYCIYFIWLTKTRPIIISKFTSNCNWIRKWRSVYKCTPNQFIAVRYSISLMNMLNSTFQR